MVEALVRRMDRGWPARALLIVALVAGVVAVSTSWTGTAGGNPPHPAGRSSAATSARHLMFLDANSPSAIPGRYLVRIRDDASVRSRGLAAVARQLSAAHHGALGHVWDLSLHGFGISMNEADARSLAADPEVDYVEQDQWVTATATQSPTPSWGLDRIDQRGLPRDNTYGYDPSGGAGVHAYIVDSGIRISHTDFGGRASYGANFVEDGQSPTDAGDCSGHGTMMAGIVGGTKYGVAKKTQLIAVRVLGCDGISDKTSVEDGINWAINDVRAHRAKAPWPAVINLSISNICRNDAQEPAPCPPGAARAVVDAENSAIAAGIPVVASAGNNNADASVNSFLQAPQVIAVGATDPTDGRWVMSTTVGSNYGNRVDLWAPGEQITTDYQDSDTSTRTDQGTSMAAPHVTGAVALLLGTPLFATASPADIRAQLIANATLGLLANLKAGSHNSLLYVPAGPTSVALARGRDGRLALFGTTPDGQLKWRSQQSAGSVGWGVWTTAATKGWLSPAAEPGADKAITLAASVGVGQVFHRQQAVSAEGDWFNWHLDGLCASMALAANADGRLEMACVNAQGMLFTRRQNAINSADWGNWSQIPLFEGVLLRSITAETNVPDGRIVLVGVDSAGLSWQTAQTAANATAWDPLDPIVGPLLSEVALVRNSADNTLEVIGTNGSGAVWSRRQTSAGSSTWTDWSRLPDKLLCHIAAETNVDGRVLVIGVDNDGGIWQISQTAAGLDNYGSWTSVPDGPLRR
jgi:subtilisin family serine protease